MSRVLARTQEESAVASKRPARTQQEPRASARVSDNQTLILTSRGGPAPGSLRSKSSTSMFIALASSAGDGNEEACGGGTLVSSCMKKMIGQHSLSSKPNRAQRASWGTPDMAGAAGRQLKCMDCFTE